MRTIPLSVVLDDNGHAQFPFRTAHGAIGLLTWSPTLPFEQSEWVQLPSGDPRPNLPLDYWHVAKLLMIAGSRFRADAQDSVLVELIGQMAQECQCRDNWLDCRCWYEYEDRSATARLSQCLSAAARLVDSGSRS